jgi:hypothetical protein
MWGSNASGDNGSGSSETVIAGLRAVSRKGKPASLRRQTNNIGGCNRDRRWDEAEPSGAHRALRLVDPFADSQARPPQVARSLTFLDLS